MKSKRLKITVFTVLSWVGFGIYGIKKQVNLSELAVYFGSLTGFIGAYIWGETKRPSGGNNA